MEQLLDRFWIDEMNEDEVALVESAAGVSALPTTRQDALGSPEGICIGEALPVEQDQGFAGSIRVRRRQNCLL